MARRNRQVIALLTLALSVCTASCSDGTRSPAAFCSTMRSEKRRILEQFESIQDAGEQSGDALVVVIAQLGGSIQAYGELRTYFAKLGEVAPEEIRAEVEIVRDSLSDQIDRAGDAVSDPLGAIAGGIFSSIATSGQLEAVNNYALNNCGESV